LRFSLKPVPFVPPFTENSTGKSVLFSIFSSVQQETPLTVDFWDEI